jgi:hypothetical protein
MMWAYFDDSYGSEQNAKKPSVALGGSIATLEDWHRLLPEWQRVVHDSGMGNFHATVWHENERDLVGYWKRLVEIANTHVSAHIGCIVPSWAVHSLEKINLGRKERRRQISQRASKEVLEWESFEGDPLSVCLSWCLAEASKLTQDEIHLVFAKTKGLKAREEKLTRMIEWIKHQPHGNFGKKDFDGEPKELVQLQVADLVAYELTAYRHYDTVRDQYKMLRPKMKLHLADPPILTSPYLWSW